MSIFHERGLRAARRTKRYERLPLVVAIDERSSFMWRDNELAPVLYLYSIGVKSATQHLAAALSKVPLSLLLCCRYTNVFLRKA